MKGHQKIVQALVDEGEAPMNPKRRDGWTPIYLAAYAGHLDVVKTLRERMGDQEASIEALKYNPNVPADVKEYLRSDVILLV